MSIYTLIWMRKQGKFRRTSTVLFYRNKCNLYIRVKDFLVELFHIKPKPYQNALIQPYGHAISSL
jgi:hypothetical protein